MTVERRPLWRHAKDWAVILLIPVLLVGLVWWTDHVGDVARCESANEWRRFFGSYLESEVPVPLAEVPAIDELSPEARAVLDGLGPVLDAGRADAVAYLAAFREQFPIRRC